LTWLVTASCGHHAEYIQELTPDERSTDPINCVANKLIECGSAWSFDAPTATDTCGTATVTILNTVTNTTGHCGNTFDVTRTWRRSEERRVGNECRTRCAPEDSRRPSINRV